MAAPLKYKTMDELEAAIESYKTYCAGHILKDGDGKILTDKYGAPIIMDHHPPTVTGLAYHLGFKSRQALLNYQGRAGFHDAITRAKMWVELMTEERLYDRDGQKGAQFSLHHNFRWKDDDKEDGKGEPGGGVVLLSPVLPEQEPPEPEIKGAQGQ